MKLLTIKLITNIKNKTIQNENGESVPHLKIKELVLVHCNIVSNYYQRE